MRVMIDTNNVISALLSLGGVVSALLKEILLTHTICLCTFSVKELQIVNQNIIIKTRY